MQIMFNRKLGVSISNPLELVPNHSMTGSEVETMYEAIRNRQASAAAKMVRDHERRHGLQQVSTFRVGDRVFVHTPRDHKVQAKFPLPWQTSARVEELFRGKTSGSAQYRLRWISVGLSGEQPGAISVYKYSGADLRQVPEHITDEQLVALGLRSIAGNPADALDNEDSMTRGAVERDTDWHTVERVRAFRLHKGRKQYLCEWMGYDILTASWADVYEHVVVVSCMLCCATGMGCFASN